jgi:predicted NBD/HSP70 family sugar kinase
MMKLSKSLKLDRSLSSHERKNFSILDIIRRRGTITKTEISQDTGLNIVTVSNYINRYAEEGLVKEVGLEASSGGRKPALLKLNTKAAYAIGVDLGRINGTRSEIVGVILDLDGQILAKAQRNWSKDAQEGVLEKSFELIEELIKVSQAPKAAISAIGLGLNSFVKGKIAAKEDFYGNLSESFSAVAETLEERFALPAFVSSATTCAAFGERMFALEERIDNLLYLNADLDCGMIIKGEIYCGKGEAGIFGLNRLEEKEFIFSDPQLNWLSNESIDLGTRDLAKKLALQGVDSRLFSLNQGQAEKISLLTVLEAAKDGDQLAKELVEHASVVLGLKIAYLVNLFNPEVVILGGGIEKGGSLILEPVRTTVRKWAKRSSAQEVKIIPSVFGEEAVAIGAASLVVAEIFAQAF